MQISALSASRSSESKGGGAGEIVDFDYDHAFGFYVYRAHGDSETRGGGAGVCLRRLLFRGSCGNGLDYVGGGAMKCDENGGCPHEIFDADFGGHKVQMCLATLGGIDVDDCHLTPADFPAIRSAIKGAGRLFCLASWHKKRRVCLNQAIIEGRAIGLPDDFNNAPGSDEPQPPRAEVRR